MPDVGKHVETMNQRFKVCGQICSSTSKHVVSQSCYPIPIYIYVAQTAFLGQDLRILVWNFTMAHLWINACPSTTHFPNIAAKTIMFIKCLGPWIFPSESQSNRRPHCQEKKKNDLHSSNLKTVLLKFSCLRLCPHLFFFFLIYFSSEPLTHCHLQILPMRCLFHLSDQPLLPSVWRLAVDKQSQVHYLSEQEIRTNLGP